MEITRPPSRGVELSSVSPPAPSPRKDGESTLQVTLYRVDHKNAARLDVRFKVADLFDPEAVAEVRADAHVALDLLLDRMVGR